MKTHSINLEQDDLKQLLQIEQSVQQHSVQLGKVAVEELKLKNALIGLNEARYKLIESAIKNNGFDIEKIAGVQVDPKGSMLVQINESEEPAEPDPAPEPVGTDSPAGE